MLALEYSDITHINKTTENAVVFAPTSDLMSLVYLVNDPKEIYQGARSPQLASSIPYLPQSSSPGFCILSPERTALLPRIIESANYCFNPDFYGVLYRPWMVAPLQGSTTLNVDVLNAQSQLLAS